jgi:hypothetical protein
VSRRSNADSIPVPGVCVVLLRATASQRPPVASAASRPAFPRKRRATLRLAAARAAAQGTGRTDYTYRNDQ